MRPHDPGKRPNFVVIVADDLVKEEPASRPKGIHC